MKVLPIDPEQSPLVILDLLFKLKIKDVMTSPVFTVPRRSTLRDVRATILTCSMMSLAKTVLGNLSSTTSLIS